MKKSETFLFISVYLYQYNAKKAVITQKNGTFLY